MLTSFRERALSSCSQAGLVNNLNDGLAWGIFPIYFARAGLSVGRIGVLVALYPAVWGLGQLVTGGLSDRIGRKPFIAGGMFVQAVAIGWIAATSGFAAVGARCARRSVSAPRWCTRHCSPRSETSRILAGARPPSVSTGSGVTAGSRSVRFSPASSPTRSGSKPRSGASPFSPRCRAFVVVVRMYETHPAERHDCGGTDDPGPNRSSIYDAES